MALITMVMALSIAMTPIAPRIVTLLVATYTMFALKVAIVVFTRGSSVAKDSAGPLVPQAVKSDLMGSVSRLFSLIREAMASA